MPGATPLGIPYPLQGETVDASSWQDMADAVDALLSQLDILRDFAVSKPTAAISGGSVAGIASGTDATPTNYTTVEWDTGGYVNLGVNPDRITVPSGVYWGICHASVSGFGTFVQGRARLFTDLTTAWGGNSLDTLSGGGPLSWGAGIMVLTGVTNSITVRTRWNGAGGPVTFSGAQLRVYKIRELADL